MAAVTVHYHEEDGSWWADSPDVAGFTAVGHTLTEVRQLVQEGIPFYLQDKAVDVREVSGSGSELRSVRIVTPEWGWVGVTLTDQGSASPAVASFNGWQTRYATDNSSRVSVGAA
ncbi:hypothetical protein CELL_02935 [Cellulomonas sp. T2.31MG-18]|uniref:type II toxin-antitoxin system HicB family antitoxin n=1 Tax=Cellulomonas sp. T2.31MG-18 TaxID=3157619 RepID=UPI0035EEFD31